MGRGESTVMNLSLLWNSVYSDCCCYTRIIHTTLLLLPLQADNVTTVSCTYHWNITSAKWKLDLLRGGLLYYCTRYFVLAFSTNNHPYPICIGIFSHVEPNYLSTIDVFLRSGMMTLNAWWTFTSLSLRITSTNTQVSRLPAFFVNTTCIPDFVT